jgi:hypothetical protein
MNEVDVAILWQHLSSISFRPQSSCSSSLRYASAYVTISSIPATAKTGAILFCLLFVRDALRITFIGLTAVSIAGLEIFALPLRGLCVQQLNSTRTFVLGDESIPSPPSLPSPSASTSCSFPPVRRACLSSLSRSCAYSSSLDCSSQEETNSCLACTNNADDTSSSSLSDNSVKSTTSLSEIGCSRI